MARVPPHDWTPMRIQELRVRLGKTQLEFAGLLAQLGGTTVHRSRVAQWECGFHRPILRWTTVFADLDRTTPKLRGPVVDYRKVLHDK